MNSEPTIRVLLGAGARPGPRVLAEAGFEVLNLEMSNGWLEQAREFSPAVILVTRTEDCGAVRRDPALAQVPILYCCSAATDADELESALAAGANDILEEELPPVVVRARISGQARAFEATGLKEQLIRDHLTGVFSRRYLFESMVEHVREYRRPGPPVLSCLMIDVDHFKSINDRYGHITGDAILKKVAAGIHQMTRKGDVVARFGGEEFVVMLPSTDDRGACQVAEKVRAWVEHQGAEKGVTISVGVSWHQVHESQIEEVIHDEETLELILTRADQALYRAKQGGRNRVCTQSELMDSERRRFPRLGLVAEAQLTLPSGVAVRHTVDVSNGGLCVRELAEVEVGDSVEILLELADWVKLGGRVAWSYQVCGGNSRCGITFERYGPRARHLLRLHLGHGSSLRAAPRLS